MTKNDYFFLLVIGFIGALTVLGFLQSDDQLITGSAVRKIGNYTALPAQLSHSLRPECKDTDRGYDWFVAGKTYYDSTNYAPKMDTCEDTLALREYYCNNGRLQSKRVRCPAGYSCQDAACQQDNRVYYVAKGSEYRNRIEAIKAQK